LEGEARVDDIGCSTQNKPVSSIEGGKEILIVDPKYFVGLLPEVDRSI
jgi:hypothetical protein